MRFVKIKYIVAVLVTLSAAMAPNSAFAHNYPEFSIEPSGAIDRFRFSCEWGYIQSLYRDYHYNILSEEGYRINESYRGIDPWPNGIALIGAGFVIPGDMMMISLHGGYSGIHEDNRIIPALLRVSFFPKTLLDNGFFYYAQAGAGFHLPSTLETRVSVLSGLGAGYHFPLTKRCSIDLILTAMAALSKPPIPNPDGPGFVAEENIRTNKAGYGSLSFSVAINF